jgi:hypothetical protein
MRRLAACAAAVALLTGCIEDDTTTAPADWAPSLATTAPVELGEDDAVLIFRLFTADLNTGTTEHLTDAEVIEFGGLACDLAGFADDLDEFLVMAVAANDGTGMSDYDAGTTLGAAIGAFCPDEADRLGFGS